MNKAERESRAEARLAESQWAEANADMLSELVQDWREQTMRRQRELHLTEDKIEQLREERLRATHADITPPWMED